MARIQWNPRGHVRKAQFPGQRGPSGLVLGTLLTVLGGALITLGTFFPWVQLSGHVPVVNLKILDLIDASNAYLFMYLIPVSGILIACFSVVSVFGGTRGWGPGWLWPTLTTISTMIATMVVIVSVVWIDQDYISLGNEKYGSATFIAAFGCVLAVAGSVIMMLGHRAHWESRQIVRPARARSAQLTKTRIKELPPDEPRFQERCPKCNSPVEADWRTCPICGEKLSK